MQNPNNDTLDQNRINSKSATTPPRVIRLMARRTIFAAMIAAISLAILAANCSSTTTTSSPPTTTSSPPTTSTTTTSPPPTTSTTTTSPPPTTTSSTTTTTPPPTTSTPPTTDTGNISLLSAAGCTDGTFVDAAANSIVAGTNNDLADDCEALVAIQNHWAAVEANSDLPAEHPLRTWGTPAALRIGDWPGITVTADRVSALQLSDPSASGNKASIGITGTIPAQLGNLTNLTSLSLNRNSLTGSIPPELGNLANLENLRLNQNSLTGSIPAELGNLANLIHLRLHSNLLSGSIHERLGRLARSEGGSLRTFYFCNNYLAGSVPEALRSGVRFGGFNSISDLSYSPVGCQYSGTRSTDTIPALSSTGCSDGTFVDIAANPRTAGTNNDLADDCEALVAIQSHWASVEANSDLPAEHPLRTWGTPAALRIDTWPGVTITADRVSALQLGDTPASGNKASIGIAGSIPAELGNLTNLTDLDLYYNRLAGSIPPELGNLTNLEHLYLYQNYLKGSIPPELGNLANLTHLYLDHNRLTGMPAELGNLTNLTHLHLHINSLAGSIPAELGNLANLTHLHLYNNGLTGSIPAELGDLANLTDLFLNGNNLTGTIPAELGDLANLTHLILSRNMLTGSIPAELGNLADLLFLQLDNNGLTGSIPSDLGKLAPSENGSLNTFFLCGNNLTGPVPAALRTGVRLVGYPVDEGYDSVACQRTSES